MHGERLALNSRLHRSYSSRSSFAQRSMKRKYKRMITTLHKYPWHTPQHVSFCERSLTSNTTVNAFARHLLVHICSALHGPYLREHDHHAPPSSVAHDSTSSSTTPSSLPSLVSSGSSLASVAARTMPFCRTCWTSPPLVCSSVMASVVKARSSRCSTAGSCSLCHQPSEFGTWLEPVRRGFYHRRIWGLLLV